MTEQRDEETIVRGYCRLHRAGVPKGYPIQPRAEMAVRRPPVVATRLGEELLCDGDHAGPHLWPDGDEAGDWPEVQGDGTLTGPD